MDQKSNLPSRNAGYMYMSIQLVAWVLTAPCVWALPAKLPAFVVLAYVAESWVLGSNFFSFGVYSSFCMPLWQELGSYAGGLSNRSV